MPIQTNLAVETDLFHVPLPATAEDVQGLNECWERQPPTNGRIVATMAPGGLMLRITAPVVMIAVSEEYWREFGRLIARTGEAWWDLCTTILDSEPQRDHPHAHALSIYRVTVGGELRFLHHEDLE